MTEAQRLAEDIVVALMIKAQQDIDAVIAEYEEELDNLNAQILAFLVKYGNSPQGYNQIEATVRLNALRDRYFELSAEYSEAVDNARREAYINVIENVMSIPLDSNSIVNERERQEIITSLLTAINNVGISSSASLFMQWTISVTSQLFNKVQQAIALGNVSQAILTQISELNSQLAFYYRRIAKTDQTQQVNQALYDYFFLVGVEYIRWETRPEATPSGSCAECEGHAHGGDNFDGIYPISAVPAFPAHPHCACVLVPV